MPIKIDNQLPARKTLESENIFVMDENRATTQDIRPLRILILNLMPTKITTETQLARLLGNTPLQIEVELLTVGRAPKHTAKEHMLAFYKTFDSVKDHYGIPKEPLPEKLFGVFHHRVTHKGSILFRGFDDVFMVPHSRHTTVSRENILKVKELKILAESEEAGVYAISTDEGRRIFITGHSEYDTETLAQEYWRDKEAGLPIKVPQNYFPDDDDSKQPASTWRSGANLLYSNWLNYFVYQSTPYDINTVPKIEK